MHNIQNRYGFEENDAVKAYHRGRRMFAIVHDDLYIADREAEYSHADWFILCGLADMDSVDELIRTTTRGTVEKSGVYFYKGYDFTCDASSYGITVKHLPELVEKLSIDTSLHLYGGRIVKIAGLESEPRKDYGSIQNLVGA